MIGNRDTWPNDVLAYSFNFSHGSAFEVTPQTSFLMDNPQLKFDSVRQRTLGRAEHGSSARLKQHKVLQKNFKFRACCQDHVTVINSKKSRNCRLYPVVRLMGNAVPQFFNQGTAYPHLFTHLKDTPSWTALHVFFHNATTDCASVERFYSGDMNSS